MELVIADEITNKELDKDLARKQFDKITDELKLVHTFSFDEAWEFILAKRKEKEEKKLFRERITTFEAEMKKIDGCLGEDPFPLKHTFADGMYIRQITVPAKALTVTKIHKQTHPFFVLKGTLSILTEHGIEKITAPYSGITKAGTKRIIYHDEVILTTVHSTNKIDLGEIESEVIAKDFTEMEAIEQKGLEALICLASEEK
jgi:hypothetical protein